MSAAIKNWATKHSIAYIVTLTVLLLLSSVVVDYLFQHVLILYTADTWLYERIFHSHHYRFLMQAAEPFNYNLFFHIPGLPEDLPTFFYFLIAGVALYLWLKRRGEVWWFLLSVLIGNILVHIVTLFDTHLLFRIRPFLVLKEVIDPVGYAAWKNISSFPSGHSRDMALYSTLISFYLPAFTWPSIILTLFIMFSRVYQGAHYPSDVVAGAAIGVAAAYITRLIIKEIRNYRTAKSAL